MVCLRNISVDTLHKGDTDDDNDDNNNNNNNNNNKNFQLLLTEIFTYHFIWKKNKHAVKMRRFSDVKEWVLRANIQGTVKSWSGSQCNRFLKIDINGIVVGLIVQRRWQMVKGRIWNNSYHCSNQMMSFVWHVTPCGLCLLKTFEKTLLPQFL